MDHDEAFPLPTKRRTNDTHEQDCRTDLEVRPVISDHTFEDLGMQKCPIKEGGKLLLVSHPTRPSGDCW